MTAGKEVIRSVNKFINEGKDFSVETTFAGGNALRQIKKAKDSG